MKFYILLLGGERNRGQNTSSWGYDLLHRWNDIAKAGWRLFFKMLLLVEGLLFLFIKWLYGGVRKYTPPTRALL